MQSREQIQHMAEILGGLAVYACFPGSAAHRAGIRYGDIVLSVNGRPTPDQDSYMRARGVHSQVASVVIFRAGAHHTVTLDLESSPALSLRAQAMAPRAARPASTAEPFASN